MHKGWCEVGLDGGKPVSVRYLTVCTMLNSWNIIFTGDANQFTKSSSKYLVWRLLIVTRIKAY